MFFTGIIHTSMKVKYRYMEYRKNRCIVDVFAATPSSISGAAKSIVCIAQVVGQVEISRIHYNMTVKIYIQYNFDFN